MNLLSRKLAEKTLVSWNDYGVKICINQRLPSELLPLLSNVMTFIPIVWYWNKFVDTLPFTLLIFEAVKQTCKEMRIAQKFTCLKFPQRKIMVQLWKKILYDRYDNSCFGRRGALLGRIYYCFWTAVHWLKKICT